jgi:putative transcriptional regulator
MLNIIFEFVGGPSDGKVVEGRLGVPSDAERHYLFSDRGRIGQKFSVASDYAIDALADDAAAPDYKIPRHYYVVTERLEDGGQVWVQATYAPVKNAASASDVVKPALESAQLDETEDYVDEDAALFDDGYDDDEEEDDEDDPEEWDEFDDSAADDQSPDFAARPVKSELDGYLLVASPRLADDWFAQSVVLVLDQNDNETFGVILNRPTEETVGDLWNEVGNIPCASGDPVFAGGPADGPVIVLHKDETSADMPVAPRVFLSVEKQHLEELVHSDDAQQRLFVGTAGWAAGQLEGEIARGDWLLLPATDELIFASPEEQWLLAMRTFGQQFYRAIGVKHFPDDARAN